MLVASCVGIGGLFYFKLLTWNDIARFLPGKTALSQSPKGYVAVYLSNGKVYFGKIEHPDSTEPIMTDVFFLNAKTQTPQPVLGDSAKKDSKKDIQARTAALSQTEFQLVRMTDQFQAPVDRLTVSRDHILYWEELADDSKVVQAIAKYHEGQGK